LIQVQLTVLRNSERLSRSRAALTHPIHGLRRQQMARKIRKGKLDIEIRKHKLPPKHKVTVVIGTGDKDYKFPENLPKCVTDKLPEPDAESEKQDPGDHGRTEWSKALPVLEEVAPVVRSPMPEIELSSCFGCFSKNRLSKMSADIFVVTVMHNADLAGPFRALDQSLNGLLTQAIYEQKFNARLGERFLLDLSELNRPQKYILVVGLGEAQSFNGHVACALVRLITEVATRVGAKSVLLPIPPRRLTGEAVSLRGTGAIVRCRLEERALRGELGCLEKFQILCSPQARPYLAEGLALNGARCQSCSDPQLQCDAVSTA
jgi:hypothetical protein